MKVLAKLRRGVLEIAGGDDCLYARPTFLQRAYLLWTFRNFRRLSVRVLNKRQRQLVERLCDSAHSAKAKKINPELVIGRAEFARLPAKKALDTVIVQQMGKTHHSTAGIGRLRGMGPLTKLPRDIARQAAEAFASSPIRQTRSNARYSLVLTLALASLVVISGAVAQRLWISHGQPTPSIGTTPSPPHRPKQADAVMGIPPVAVTPVSTKPNAALTQPVRSEAPQVSMSMQATPAPNVKAVTGATELVRADGGLPSFAAKAPTSHIRVFLAPRSMVYPSLPTSGFARDAKKQILVKAIVNTDGTVDDVQVPGQSPGVAAAIAKTVKQWRYQPYLLNGQPVEVETRMIFTVLGPDTITVRYLPAGEDPAND